MNELDIKLNEAFPGKVVRKDLLHEIKRAVNVPSFVLEFLLSRYCASEDPEEIEEGKKAVLQTIEKNYVRPDESNKAQAIVEQKKRHKFIDKIHVKYVEREKRYWAEMENFALPLIHAFIRKMKSFWRVVFGQRLLWPITR